MTLLLRGHVPSKKNSWHRIINRRTGKPGMAIDKNVKSQIDGLLLQAQAQRPGRPLSYTVCLSVRFFVKDGRRDLDGLLTTLLDVLVKAGIVKNDSIAHLQELRAIAVVNKSEEERTEVTVW